MKPNNKETDGKHFSNITKEGMKRWVREHRLELLGTILVAVFFSILLIIVDVPIVVSIPLAIIISVISYFCIVFWLFGLESEIKLSKMAEIIERFDSYLQSDVGQQIKDGIEVGIEDRFADVLNKFFESHDCAFSECYTQYPRRRYMDKISNEIPAHMINNRRGFTIWGKEINLDKYSNIVDSLLSVSEESVLSTTYYNNEIFVKEIGRSRGAVISWLKKLEKNRKEKLEKQTEFRVSRVHVFDSPENYDNFIELIRNNQQALRNYCDYYATEGVTLWGYINPKKVTTDEDSYYPEFFGEYVIFDKQVAVIYDDIHNQCTLFCGTIANELSESFKENSPENERRKNHPDIFKNIRKELCNL